MVSVGRGVNVKVKVGDGANVSVAGTAVNGAGEETPVDVLPGNGEGEAGCPPPDTVQERMIEVSMTARSICLYFTP